MTSSWQHQQLTLDMTVTLNKRHETALHPRKKGANGGTVTKQHKTALHTREKDAVRARVCTKCHSELPFDK